MCLLARNILYTVDVCQLKHGINRRRTPITFRRMIVASLELKKEQEKKTQISCYTTRRTKQEEEQKFLSRRRTKREEEQKFLSITKLHATHLAIFMS